jgi:hypothetical protein
MIPTRLNEKYEPCFEANSVRCMTYLESDNAQLTSIKLGVDLPGYVKVQLTIFRIARVLLRTPMSEPGGGKENLTEVAASV